MQTKAPLSTLSLCLCYIEVGFSPYTQRLQLLYPIFLEINTSKPPNTNAATILGVRYPLYSA